MRLKYLLIDLSKIPDGWDLDKWMEYMNSMKLPLKDTYGFKELELDVTIWQWIKYNLGFKDIFTDKEKLISFRTISEKWKPKHLTYAFKGFNGDRSDLAEGSFVVPSNMCDNTENIDIGGKTYFAHKAMLEMLLSAVGDIGKIKLLWCVDGTCSAYKGHVSTAFSIDDGYEVHFLYKK